MRLLCLLLLACAGCLDGTAPTDDMSASEVDMAGMVTPDLQRADLFGLLNCAALDKAEAMCNANNATCVSQLRKMATPSAIQKDEALQQCFHAQCPLNGVCMPDSSGNYSAACVQCVQNTVKADKSACTPTGAPECTQCYNQAQICLADG